MRKLALILSMAFALPAGPLLVGCSREEAVNEDQPAKAFKADVDARLSGFASRLKAARDRRDQVDEAARAGINSNAEMADEEIETLRQTYLAKLDKATGDEAEGLKGRINDSLAEIDRYVRKAEDAANIESTGGTVMTGGGSEYVVQTRATLDKLRGRLKAVQQRAENATGDAKDQLRMATESAEEAIQEAGDRLDDYQKATKDDADSIRGNLDSLLETAKDKLDQADRVLGG